MGAKTVYVGLDSSQYSNGSFKTGCKKEICDAFFSYDPDFLSMINPKERGFSVLEEACESCFSVSSTLDPKMIPDGSRLIIYAGRLFADFYLKNVERDPVKKIEFHIDGPVKRKERSYLQNQFFEREAVVKGYEKRKHRKKSGEKSVRKKNQPKIIVAADSLSNYLFRKKRGEFFLEFGCQNIRKIKIMVNGREFQHTHLLPS